MNDDIESKMSIEPLEVERSDAFKPNDLNGDALVANDNIVS